MNAERDKYELIIKCKKELVYEGPLLFNSVPDVGVGLLINDELYEVLAVTFDFDNKHILINCKLFKG